MDVFYFRALLFVILLQNEREKVIVLLSVSPYICLIFWYIFRILFFRKWARESPAHKKYALYGHGEVFLLYFLYMF